MDFSIRNYSAVPLTLFIEPYCDQYEIPPGGEAVAKLEDGKPHSIDFQPDNWVSLWDEGVKKAKVEIHSTYVSLTPKTAVNRP